MADLTIPKDDKGYNLVFSVVDSAGDAYDLTDYTAVTLKVWKAGSSATPQVDYACTVDAGTGGTCYYTIRDGDFDVHARYKLELELTKTDVVESTKNYDILVEASP